MRLKAQFSASIAHLADASRRILRRTAIWDMRVRPQPRRLLISVTIWVIVMVMIDAIGFGAPPSTMPVSRSPVLGLTFSQRQSDYLKLPWQQVYGATLGLSPGLIRLGAYWDQIERVPGMYDFSVLDAQLDAADSHGQAVVLTVGMKAPRWPEYFLPAWLQRRLTVTDGGEVTSDADVRALALRFVQRTILHVRHRGVVTIWQVENEPLDAAGPKRWQIGREFLAEEVALVRQLDDRPIAVTTFVDVGPLMNVPSRRSELRDRAAAILGVADILGLDLYPSRGFRSYSRDWYFSWPSWVWEPAVTELRQLALARGKAAWIMEAQAEPWEPGRLVYTDEPLSRSVQPPIAIAGVERLTSIGFDTVLLWGVEHWYMRRELHQQSDWWTAMSALFVEEPTSVSDVGGRDRLAAHEDLPAGSQRSDAPMPSAERDDAIGRPTEPTTGTTSG